MIAPASSVERVGECGGRSFGFMATFVLDRSNSRLYVLK